MGLQQQANATVTDHVRAAPDVAAAAARYQAFRDIEAEHLARMAGQDLSLEWSPQIRQVVFNAGDHVRHARDARLKFRGHIRATVASLRSTRAPLSAVLRHTRSLIQTLQSSGALRNDGGWLEAEVLEWAIEEYESIR